MIQFFFEKILKTVEKSQDLKQAVILDPMTGLLNKTSAETEIASVCRNAQGVLLMIDLDSFKLVNDMYGHAMGDKILNERNRAGGAFMLSFEHFRT